MSDDDPFAEPDDDAEKTVIRPSPGGRRPTAAAAPPPQQRAAAPTPTGPQVAIAETGINPLVAAASSLLGLAIRLKNRASHSDVEGLHGRVVNEVKKFERAALNSGASPEAVRAARYALCATVDDLVLNTPWGSRSLWTTRSMVGTFHNELSGGERFYDILSHLEKNPGRNTDVLELMYLCLTLGFEGRYRIEQRGSSEHGQIRDGLFRVVRGNRGEFERELSPHWRGIDAGHRPLTSYVPVWVVGAIAAGLLTLTFMGVSYALSIPADLTESHLTSAPPAGGVVLARVQPAPPPPPPPMPAPELRVEIEGFLAPEIQQGLVVVEEDFQTITIRITGQNMFRSGSDEVQQQFLPLLQRIAAALNDKPGDVIVEGHSDGDAIRTVRFPSNWHLSLARAEATMALIARDLQDPGRLRAEGMADTDRLVQVENTAADKARNRRIELVLLK